MNRYRDRRDVETPPADNGEAPAAPASFVIERGHALAVYRPAGSRRIHELAAGIGDAIEHCRREGLAGLLVDPRGIRDLPGTTPVDRFLLVEEWAAHSRGQVAIAFVIVDPIVPPPSFVRRAAADFGLAAEMFSDEPAARAWLAGLRRP